MILSVLANEEKEEPNKIKITQNDECVLQNQVRQKKFYHKYFKYNFLESSS